jgi:hypothetical protein
MILTLKLIYESNENQSEAQSKIDDMRDVSEDQTLAYRK